MGDSNKLGDIFCGLAGGVVRIALMFGIAIASIVIGAMNLKDCPAEKYIPIYLVVSGSVGIVTSIIGIAHQKAKREHGSDPEQKCTCCMVIEFLMQIFMLAWFIAGSVWVYRNYGKVDYEDDSADNYCDKTTFLFTFWTITIGYGMIALALVIAILVCCCTCCCAGN